MVTSVVDRLDKLVWDAYYSILSLGWASFLHGARLNFVAAARHRSTYPQSEAHHLPEAAVAYVFHLLNLALRNPKTVSVAVQKQTMAVVARHVTQIGALEEYPRMESITLLEHVTANYDNLQAKVYVHPCWQRAWRG